MQKTFNHGPILNQHLSDLRPPLIPNRTTFKLTLRNRIGIDIGIKQKHCCRLRNDYGYRRGKRYIINKKSRSTADWYYKSFVCAVFKRENVNKKVLKTNLARLMGHTLVSSPWQCNVFIRVFWVAWFFQRVHFFVYPPSPSLINQYCTCFCALRRSSVSNQYPDQQFFRGAHLDILYTFSSIVLVRSSSRSRSRRRRVFIFVIIPVWCGLFRVFIANFYR